MTKKTKTFPSTQEIENEIQRVRYRDEYIKVFKSTLASLIILSAIIALVFTLVLPTFRTQGSAMSPTFSDGQLVSAMRTAEVVKGDVVCFYYNNKVLIKRVIAVGGDKVDIDQDGNVTVNDVPIDEPYIQKKAKSDCTISFPYQVPIGKFFVLGDDRSISIDSRHTEVGCVAQEQIIGKVVLKLWPLKDISIFK